jgi:hypothetical protein
MLIALTASAARFHAHAIDGCDAAQEMNRCLRLVNVAASRRQTEKHRRATSASPAAAAAAARP